VKVGLVIDRLDPSKGGAEAAVTDLAQAARTAGHQVIAYALAAADPWVGYHESWAGSCDMWMRVRLPPLPRGARDREFARRAVRSARMMQCDVVVGVRHITGVDVYWPHGGVHAETLAAVERSKGRVAGAVSHALHSVSPKQRALLALERRFFEEPGGARIWCVSDLVRREIVARWPRCEPLVEVHRNGVDVEAFRPEPLGERRARVRRELGIANNVPVLLFLGGAWRLKGWPVLLDALTRLRGHAWTCVAAGARDEPAARAAARAGLADRVRVLPRQDPRPLYAAADVFVAPTWRDPCPLATLEALASGLPVVTTTANGAAEDAGPAVSVVPAGSAAALAGALVARLAAPLARAQRPPVRTKAEWLAGLVASLERAAATSR
jgi:UDP-glucose:(heptosyl)LPS alpha-1,3-glucosyltransferase